MTDARGCIVPFDRSHIPDRRLESTLPQIIDSERNFYIDGELIASVSNIYDSQSPGRWKQLELYQTPSGEYVCLEIWRTILEGKHDQFWLATCSDLKTAREFFGNNRLASDLFDEVSTHLFETIN